MRGIILAASLFIALLSTAVDFIHPSPGSSLCRYGGCRFDQIFAGVDSSGADRDSLAALVNADPANPLVWCAYAQALAVQGETQRAESAFDHAVSLGPRMPPVLMRAANFDFTHGRREHGVLLSMGILSQTSAFDEIIFSYLQNANVPAVRVLGTAIPAMARPARSWLYWLRAHGTDQDLGETWVWMKQNLLLDENSADEVVWTLWNRASYHAAQALWIDWVSSSGGSDFQRQLLSNRDFRNSPKRSPFDWELGSPPSVAVTRANGLEIRFAGTENVAFSHVRQFTVAASGRYRFSAEVSSENLTTDQGPFFHVFDPTNPDGLNVETNALMGTVVRSRISVDFTVTRRTEPIAVRLERRPSQRFDNRISGMLHIHEASLELLSTPAQR